MNTSSSVKQYNKEAKFMKKIAVVLLVILILTAGLFCLSTEALAYTPEDGSPFNLIIFVMDTSGSFYNSLSNAWDDVYATLKQYQHSDTDYIVVIKLEKYPSTVWHGPAKRIKEGRQKFMSLARTTREIGTNVSGAIDEAAYWAKKIKAQAKYLFVDSDFIQDPAKDGTHFISPEEIHWKKLEDVKVFGYYIHPQQEDYWQRMFDSHNISATLDRGGPDSYEPPAPPVVTSESSPIDSLWKLVKSLFFLALLGIGGMMAWGAIRQRQTNRTQGR
jgi:hypothetical protein